MNVWSAAPSGSKRNAVQARPTVPLPLPLALAPGAARFVKLAGVVTLSEAAYGTGVSTLVVSLFPKTSLYSTGTGSVVVFVMV